MAGISAISISLDAPAAAGHDALRGVDGAFDTAMAVLRSARRVGLGIQVAGTIDL